MGVKNGGCAGQEYVFEYANEKGPIDEVVEDNAPLVKEADPELERLLAEEEEIERSIRQHHEAPKFHGDED